MFDLRKVAASLAISGLLLGSSLAPAYAAPATAPTTTVAKQTIEICLGPGYLKYCFEVEI